jgi:hypothetical protein
MNQNRFRLYLPTFVFLLLFQNHIFAQSDWSIRNPFPSYQMIKEMVWIGDKIVAITNGYVLTSPDGIYWTYSNNGAINRFNDIVWAGKKAVCVGDKGTVAISADGISWQQHTVDTSERLTCINKADSMLIAWAEKRTGQPGKCFTSKDDGTTWESHVVTGIPDSVRLILNDICYKNGKYIAVGFSLMNSWDGIILASPDGIAWTLNETVKNNRLYGITCTDSLIVAVGGNGTVLTSKDVLTWNKSEIPSNVSFSNVVWNGTKLVAVGESGHIGTSSDGITWTTQKNSRWLETVTWTGNKFIAAGYNVVNSTNGLTWETIVNSPLEDYYSVCYGNHQYVVCGHGSSKENTLAYSADGINWNYCTVEIKTSLEDVVWTGTIFLAVGDSGKLATSTDGITWNVRKSDFAETFSHILYDNTIMVVYSSDSKTIISSSDGINWTKREPATVSTPLPVFSADKKLFIFPANDTIFISQNGIQWYTVPQNVDIGGDAFKSVIYTGNKYYSVTGRDDSLLTSTDGIHWEKCSFNGFDVEKKEGHLKMTSINWTGKEFFVVGIEDWGDTAIALSSLDGTAWNQIPLPPACGLMDICMGDGLMVAVGWAGQILTRPYSTNAILSDLKKPVNRSTTTILSYVKNKSLSIFFPANKHTEANAVFYNLAGKKIAESKFEIRDGKAAIPLRNMVEGNYVLRIGIGGQKMSVPVMIK